VCVPVFLTGATGFLGRELLRRLLEQGETVHALVRAGSREQARERLRSCLRGPGFEEPRDLGARLVPCAGALEAPDLGLARVDRERVAVECDAILHCGASVRFDLSLDAARAVNVGGTRAVLALARECAARRGLRRFDHVSTAFVAGLRTDLVREDELDGAAGWKNSYERSKFEAELLVREAARELPIAVHRPSIVVGESKGGATTSFATIYVPIRIYALGLWRILPGRLDTPLDLVPVDFAREALLAIRGRPDSVGGTYHLAAGPEGATTIGDLAGVVQRFFPRRKPIRCVDPDLWRRFALPWFRAFSFGRLREVTRVGEAYIPYLAGNPSFDTTNARAALAGTGLAPPHVRDYVHRLLDYALQTDFGRRAPRD
jgi:long-chain acyl-CoA synthetase